MLSEQVLEQAIAFHGHRCPAMPLGLRAGLAALRVLNVPRAANKELYCLCEVGQAHAAMCFADGVQVATGCTFGKNNIRRLDYSKSAITLIDVNSSRCVRVAVRAEVMLRSFDSKFFELRKSGVEPQDIEPDIVEPLIKRILQADEKELFVVSTPKDCDFKPMRGTFYWQRCSDCGEVVFGDGLRVAADGALCIPCYQKRR